MNKIIKRVKILKAITTIAGYIMNVMTIVSAVNEELEKRGL